jgi:hypothetical protein
MDIVSTFRLNCVEELHGCRRHHFFFRSVSLFVKIRFLTGVNQHAISLTLKTKAARRPPGVDSPGSV